MAVLTAVAAAENFGEEPLANIYTFIEHADIYHKAHPEQRKGQAWMNFLSQCGDTGFELYELATGRSFDPFYAIDNQPKLQSFVGWLVGYLGR